MESMTLGARRIFGAAYDPPEHVWLAVQFSPSEAGRAAGKAFLSASIFVRRGAIPR
jgi:hypothetical protein